MSLRTKCKVVVLISEQYEEEPGYHWCSIGMRPQRSYEHAIRLALTGLILQLNINH